MINATIVFLTKLNKDKKITHVCLGLKLRGFGKGNYDGFGGKLKKNESILDTALRELEEESTVISNKKYLEKIAVVNAYHKDPKLSQKVHIYLCNKWIGTPSATEEMAPFWFKTEDIPYSEMWEDMSKWLKQVLKGEKLEVNVKFDDQYRMIHYSQHII